VSRALVVREHGEPRDVLRLEEVADHAPGPGHVAIAVRAIGCNFPDILICQGKYQVKPPMPFSPGLELAGEVEAVGEGVHHLRAGQRVLALLHHGAYASRVVVPAGDAYAIPDAMGFAEAAAFGVVYQTGISALAHRSSLRKGETLLVHAAAGGVGLAAVQLGKALGARVIATAGGARKLEVARQAGADVVIDYKAEDWVARVKAETDGRGADVVFDPVGGDVFDGSTRCIAWEGRILVIGFAGGRIADVATNRILLKNIDVVGVHWGQYRDRQPALVDAWMTRLLAMVESGKLRPLVSQRFPLERAADALAALGARDTVGKVVLEP
jgi:NADPH2:quinone reductase